MYSVTICSLISTAATNLEEGINVANGRDVLWDERTQLCLQLNGLRCVASDVAKQFLQLSADLQMIVIPRIVHPAARFRGKLKG